MSIIYAFHHLLIMAKEEQKIELIESIEELKDEIGYSSFVNSERFTHLSDSERFIHICNLKPQKEPPQKLEIEVKNKKWCKDRGLVYIFV